MPIFGPVTCAAELQSRNLRMHGRAHVHTLCSPMHVHISIHLENIYKSNSFTKEAHNLPLENLIDEEPKFINLSLVVHSKIEEDKGKKVHLNQSCDSIVSYLK